MRTPRMKEGQVARLRVINVTKEGAMEYFDLTDVVVEK